MIDNLTPQEEIRYAGFWIRLMANILDSLVLLAVYRVLTDLLGLDWTRTFLGLNYSELIISLAYFVILTVVYGQTLGKMALGIKVVSQDGSPNTWGAILLRETIGKFLSAILLLIGYLMIAFDGRKRALHDRIAETYVVRVNQEG